MTLKPDDLLVTVFKAHPTGDRRVPAGVIRITVEQPAEWGTRSIAANRAQYLADASNIVAVLHASLPGGTLNALTGLLLEESGRALLRVTIGTGEPPEPPSFVSASCQGERCRCGAPATAKVGEEIAWDDPAQHRHNLTAYVCQTHFREIMGERGVMTVEHMRLSSKTDGSEHD